nr:hypothetical protein [Tanacetum cinerariifolium]
MLSSILSTQEDESKVQEAVEIVTTAKIMTEVVTAVAAQVSAVSTNLFAAKPKVAVARVTAVPVTAAYSRRR